MADSRPNAEAILSRAWQSRGPLACLLWPLSLLFGALSGVRRLLFALGVKRSERLPVPVVVVGNIFVGGTGKTPFAIWLIEALRAAGYTPGVISRGYGGGAQQTVEVSATSAAAQVGDEPLLIAQRTGAPLVVGRRRVQAARALLAAHPQVDVLVSDDGLQHYAMARDIEIVLSDARGVGNGWLLPAGPLREPASRRRDFSVLNVGSSGVAGAAPAGVHAMQLLATEAVQLAPPAARKPLARMGEGGLRLAALAGIGNPERFFATLQAAGLSFSRHPLPDHYDFAVDPFAGLAADVILITEKDAVKCRAIEAIRNDPRIWVVPVTARIDGALAEHIVEKLRERPTA
ncbi:tetraacyldisaccharide 4'-kinase [Herbaspirillum seropedicae]|uniref:tetraacyldisaccharide 4'-kinase n=1 Tax=Herbaspirillum seropedicae TaxID=964 RepID=UPI001120399E|nr:tetraacyldisaccharide 4'-kinase [Herbaspirillum seropedicae]QDD63659.1 tetraacyldisaccharide 4'-kinase [Herbaspirillum seropedicae]